MILSNEQAYDIKDENCPTYTIQLFLRYKIRRGKNLQEIPTITFKKDENNTIL
jgi:hypothetical protein